MLKTKKPRGQKSRYLLPSLNRGKSKTSPAVNNRKRRQILDFARDNKLVIHPGRGYDYYIEGYFLFMRCPCDENRLNCPCNEAIQECEKDGMCLCRLFWRDLDTYKESHVKE